MATELRDLDADRKDVDKCKALIESGDDGLSQMWSEEITYIADAALDEIARLKRLTVWEQDGKWVARISQHKYRMGYDTQSDAWAAARKAATNGK